MHNYWENVTDPLEEGLTELYNSLPIFFGLVAALAVSIHDQKTGILGEEGKFYVYSKQFQELCESDFMECHRIVGKHGRV
ncbi:unnamed protein product [Allacma fusca]|uniref:Uncharacterized protein n=1 Tax=Allacma fusca TaxID=39272 RepID=A0A8J2PHE5_9HEXA|nr:unnamed protein product [Allacma fusca]